MCLTSGISRSITETSNPATRGDDTIARDKKHMRLVMWNVDVLARALAQIILRRKATGIREDKIGKMRKVEASLRDNRMAFDEVEEIVELPAFDRNSTSREEEMELPAIIYEQLSSYVQALAAMYNDNAFHNFEHASHGKWRFVVPSSVGQVTFALLRSLTFAFLISNSYHVCHEAFVAYRGAWQQTSVFLRSKLS
jgi:hypothetical protein